MMNESIGTNLTSLAQKAPNNMPWTKSLNTLSLFPYSSFLSLFPIHFFHVISKFILHFIFMILWYIRRNIYVDFYPGLSWYTAPKTLRNAKMISVLCMLLRWPVATGSYIASVWGLVARGINQRVGASSFIPGTPGKGRKAKGWADHQWLMI